MKTILRHKRRWDFLAHVEKDYMSGKIAFFYYKDTKHIMSIPTYYWTYTLGCGIRRMSYSKRCI